MTRGGGGVQTPPKKYDIICEQPLYLDIKDGTEHVIDIKIDNENWLVSENEPALMNLL